MASLFFPGRTRHILAALVAVMLTGLFAPTASAKQAVGPTSTATPVSAQHAPTQHLFKLCGMYCTVVNAKGQPISPRLFQSISDIADGIIIYAHDGKHGAINAQGKRLIKPLYDPLYLLKEQGLIQGYATNSKNVDPDTTNAENTTFLFDLNGRLILKRSHNTRINVWQGHPYYKKCPASASGGSADNTPPASCRTVFTNRQGKPIASFAYFQADDHSKLGVASSDGKTYGYIGPDLQYRIAPHYTYVDKIEGNDAIVYTAKGAGLVDTQGKIHIKVGRFKKLFGGVGDLFYVGFRTNKSCGQFIRRNGDLIKLPTGVCPAPSSLSRAHNYALIHGPKGYGAIDGAGKIIITPQYGDLVPMTSQYLRFASKYRGKYGLVDRNGNVLIPATYQLLKVGPADTFLAQKGYRQWLLLDSHGNKLGNLVFYSLETVSESLISYTLRKPDGQRTNGFIRPDGSVLPLHGEADAVVSRNAKGQPTALILSQYVKPGVFRKGLMDAKGHVIIAPETDIAKIRPIGDGLWRVKRYQHDAGAVDAVYTADGKAVAALAPYNNIGVFRGGVTTAMREKDHDPVLVNTNGQVLASYKALFPQYTSDTRGGDSIVSQTLDVCYVVDPTAEPEDQPVLHGANVQICASPGLRKLSRQTEKTYYNLQAGRCLPQVFTTLRPTYDKAINTCTDDSCLRQTMLAFQKKLNDTAKTCSQQPLGITWLDTAISKKEQSVLTKILATDSSNYDAIDATAAKRGDQGSLSFRKLKLGSMPATLVVQNTFAHNQPFWLLTNNTHHKWRIILQDYAGYVRGFDVARASHNGLPVLRIQQHASCCEHDVQYFEYDGNTYQPYQQCTQLYDDDETAVLFCGSADAADKDTPHPS